MEIKIFNLGDYTMFLIYCHENKINGKRYIGYTSYVNNPNNRWRDGLGYLNNHHKVFAAAILKYNWNNFEHIILENGLRSLEEAKSREQYWIAFYHTYVGDPKCWGYNATIGGDGSKGRIMSAEEREYRRQLKLGTKASDITKRKMSAVRKGKPQNMTTKKIVQCQAAFAAMIAANKKAVICIETGERWGSVTEAAKALGVAETTVSACLNGRMKTVKKLHIQYENKVKEFNNAI